jgi:cytochrome b
MRDGRGAYLRNLRPGITFERVQDPLRLLGAFPWRQVAAGIVGEVVDEVVQQTRRNRHVGVGTLGALMISALCITLNA